MLALISFLENTFWLRITHFVPGRVIIAVLALLIRLLRGGVFGVDGGSGNKGRPVTLFSECCSFRLYVGYLLKVQLHFVLGHCNIRQLARFSLMLLFDIL